VIRTFLTLLIAAVAAGASADAHHSFAAHYFEDQTVSIEGELVEFEYRPHAWVHVMAKDENGQVQRFSAEWASVDRLRRAGVAKRHPEAGGLCHPQRQPRAQSCGAQVAPQEHSTTVRWLVLAGQDEPLAFVIRDS
jgi:hypothetical protein